MSFPHAGQGGRLVSKAVGGIVFLLDRSLPSDGAAGSGWRSGGRHGTSFRLPDAHRRSPGCPGLIGCEPEIGRRPRAEQSHRGPELGGEDVEDAAGTRGATDRGAVERRAPGKNAACTQSEVTGDVGTAEAAQTTEPLRAYAALASGSPGMNSRASWYCASGCSMATLGLYISSNCWASRRASRSVAPDTASRHQDRTRVPSSVNPEVISSSISSTRDACRDNDCGGSSSCSSV